MTEFLLIPPCLVIFQTPKAKKPQKIYKMVALSLSITPVGSFTLLTKSLCGLAKPSRHKMNLNDLPLTKAYAYPSTRQTRCPFTVMNLFLPLLKLIKNLCFQGLVPIIKMVLPNMSSKQATDLSLWLFALEHAVWLWKHLPNQHTHLAPLKLFMGTTFDSLHHLHHSHVWGCPCLCL